MEGATHLLVEENRAARLLDPRVSADAQLPEEAGAFVGGERLLEEGLVSLGRGLNDLSTFEFQVNTFDHIATIVGWVGDPNPPAGRVNHRAGKDFAVGEVMFSVAADPGAVLDRHTEVDIWSGDV